MTCIFKYLNQLLLTYLVPIDTSNDIGVKLIEILVFILQYKNKQKQFWTVVSAKWQKLAVKTIIALTALR